MVEFGCFVVLLELFIVLLEVEGRQ